MKEATYMVYHPLRVSWHTWHGARQRTGKSACQLSIKTRNRVGKRVDGCRLKRIERIHHPYFTETTFDVPRSVVVLVVTSSLLPWNLCLCLFRPRSLSLYRTPSKPPYPPHSSLVSDRVPLFRVLYYFFYQSARFQGALRPAESCVINHEM